MARLFLIVVGSVIAATGIACTKQSPPVARHLQLGGFEEIRDGMSQEEVERLLGGPPGNYGQNAGYSVATAEGVNRPPGSIERQWTDDHNCFEIFFDAQGRVVRYHKRFRYEQKPRE